MVSIKASGIIATPGATALPQEGPTRPIGRAQVKVALTRDKILARAMVIAAVWLLSASLTDGDFLTPRNLSNLLRQMAITGMLAADMVFGIIAGEIDLSVGSLLGLLGGVGAILDARWQMPFSVTLLAVMVLGAAIGAFNGYWVAYRGIPSFIVTLAGLLAVRVILLGITSGVTVRPISSDFVAIGQSYLPGAIGFGLAAILYALLPPPPCGAGQGAEHSICPCRPSLLTSASSSSSARCSPGSSSCSTPIAAFRPRC